jgi:biotin-(acetyl-CoA carboxylase) ligase
MAHDVDLLVTSLCEELKKGYALLSGESGPVMIRDLWCSLSTYAVGKKVVVDASGEIFSGTTCGVAENGALIVRTDDGTTRTVETGEISRVRPG